MKCALLNAVTITGAKNKALTSASQFPSESEGEGGGRRKSWGGGGALELSSGNSTALNIIQHWPTSGLERQVMAGPQGWGRQLDSSRRPGSPVMGSVQELDGQEGTTAG